MFLESLMEIDTAAGPVSETSHSSDNCGSAAFDNDLDDLNIEQKIENLRARLRMLKRIQEQNRSLINVTGNDQSESAKPQRI